MARIKKLIATILDWADLCQSSKEYYPTEIQLGLFEMLNSAYKHSIKDDRDDALVPYTLESVKETEPICVKKAKYKDGKIRRVVEVNYNWPENEFCSDAEENVVIEVGTVLDRLGSSDGSFLSPLNEHGSPFTVAARALPYLFMERSVEYEPSYHRYRVIKAISKQAIADNLNHIKSIEVKNYCELRLRGGIKFGTVANVDAFGVQGYGGGKQYLICVPVQVLIDLDFLEVI